MHPGTSTSAAQLRETLARRIKALMALHGMTQYDLQERTGYDRSNFSRALAGRDIPSAAIAAAFDEVFDTGREIADLRQAAWDAKLRERRAAKASRLGLPELGQSVTTSGIPGREPNDGLTVEAETQGVGTTDRRDALRAMALGTTAALGPVAAEISRRIATADPDPLSLEQAEAQISKIAAVYRVTPHGVLMDAMGPEWQKIEMTLDRRVSPRVRARLTLVAGQYAFYLGLLAFDLGDDDTARGLLTVASQHAAQARDLLPARSPRHSDVLLLDGSVAAIRSSVAYFCGSYGEAADFAAQARDDAHPFTRPILAGCEARAAARAHRPDDAQAALADMQEHVWDGPIMPGPNPGDAAFAHGFLAGTLAHLGNGTEAEHHARTGLELEKAAGPDHYVQIGGTYNTLCRAYLRRPTPDPERAADAGQQALLILQGRPNRTVIQNAGQMWRHLDAHWPDLPAVQHLGEIVTTSRRALQPTSRGGTAV